MIKMTQDEKIKELKRILAGLAKAYKSTCDTLERPAFYEGERSWYSLAMRELDNSKEGDK